MKCLLLVQIVVWLYSVLAEYNIDIMHVKEIRMINVSSRGC